MVGIDARNKHIIDQKYICCTCLLILQDPVQHISCGCRQCQSCFNNQQKSTITCPRCRTEIKASEMKVDRGFKSDMQSLPIECSFCSWTGILSDYREHLNQSHPHPICHYCNQHFDSVDKLNQHKLAQCQHVTVDCVLKEFGCDEPISRGKMKEHCLSLQHQETAMKVVSRMRSQLVDRQMDIDLPRTTTSDSTTMHLSEVYEIVNILSGGMETLHDDEQRLSKESLQMQLQLQALAEDISEVKLSTDASRNVLEGVKQNQDILDQDLSSLKDKINDMQFVSYDGTFVWKINNVKEKIADAQSERQMSVYSPPFYSSPTGYKMRLRLYLHGDGNARRTHMSLFFVLMRGVNDAILKFPFSYKVTFCLYDQTNQGKHFVDSFRPDIRSNSFQRPRPNIYNENGIPKFFSLAMLEQEGCPYVRDDTMFIKVMIDFGDTPTTLLPYAMSLNPGLPTHIQQVMIKQEIERQNKEWFQQRAEATNEHISCETGDN